MKKNNNNKEVICYTMWCEEMCKKYLLFYFFSIHFI